jgi:hypothetical protein
MDKFTGTKKSIHHSEHTSNSCKTPLRNLYNGDISPVLRNNKIEVEKNLVTLLNVVSEE